MAFDLDKYCLVDGSPTTVLPVPRHRSIAENRNSSGKPKHRNGTPSLTEQLELDFGVYSSGSCKVVRSQRISREGGEGLKRESVYQSSEEVGLIFSTDASVGRKKIELSPGTASLFSLGIIDALCSLDEESSRLEKNRDSVMYNSEQSTTSACGDDEEFFYDDSEITAASSPAAVEEKNQPFDLHRSLSSRYSSRHSPAKSESESSRFSSPKTRFSPVKNMFNSFGKSKFRRSQLSNFNETDSSCKKAVCRSLFSDISDHPHHVESNPQNEERENHNSVPQRSSPAHLHGLLKMGNKHGVPYFQFSVESPEDVYVAKTWIDETASNYVYTFHSVPHRRKRSGRESCMVGRMHVSCQQHTEFKNSGQSDDSMVTEFVLQDIPNSIKSTTCNDDTDPFGSSTAAKLHPELETAAIVMQVPLEKRESLKFKSGDKKIDETPPNLLDICRVGKSVGTSCTTSLGTMHVVIPDGSHSFPISGSCGPSPLLDRWRFGGGCDCGGWDMACPLNIFTNKISESQPFIQNQNRANLFVQGRKESIPAFSMGLMEDGKYAVDFHAQLSSLQALAIGVAILHAAEASPKSKPMMQNDWVREEELKAMQVAIAEEEKCKTEEVEEVVPSFIVNPPFSPIARV